MSYQSACLLFFLATCICWVPATSRYCSRCWGCPSKPTELILLAESPGWVILLGREILQYWTYLSRCQQAWGRCPHLVDQGNCCCCSLPAVGTIGKNSFAIKYNQRWKKWPSVNLGSLYFHFLASLWAYEQPAVCIWESCHNSFRKRFVNNQVLRMALNL